MSPNNDTFPFSLGDIAGWITRNKNGTTIRYDLVTPEQVRKESATAGKAYQSGNNWFSTIGSKKSFSQWCNHAPEPGVTPALFTADGISLWIGDGPGCKKHTTQFDVCIDGGNALDIPRSQDFTTLYGDPELSAALGAHVTPSTDHNPYPGVRILKIRWFDRAAAPVEPSFWPALLEELKKERDSRGLSLDSSDPLRVMTICQGGHGRSGSAAACLMMCMTDYTPLDALTHIRAIHCARAIESKEQHLYLNKMAAYLGRTQNALEAEGVKSFKDRMLASKSEFMVPFHPLLKAGKGALVSEREETFC